MCVICVTRVRARSCHTNVAYPPFRSPPVKKRPSLESRVCVSILFLSGLFLISCFLILNRFAHRFGLLVLCHPQQRSRLCLDFRLSEVLSGLNLHSLAVGSLCVTIFRNHVFGLVI